MSDGVNLDSLIKKYLGDGTKAATTVQNMQNDESLTESVFYESYANTTTNNDLLSSYANNNTIDEAEWQQLIYDAAGFDIDDERIKTDEKGDVYVVVDGWDDDSAKNNCLTRIVPHAYDLDQLAAVTGMEKNELAWLIRDAIAAKNNLADPNLIYTGARMYLPSLEEIGLSAEQIETYAQNVLGELDEVPSETEAEDENKFESVEAQQEAFNEVIGKWNAEEGADNSEFYSALDEFMGNVNPDMPGYNGSIGAVLDVVREVSGENWHDQIPNIMLYSYSSGGFDLGSAQEVAEGLLGMTDAEAAGTISEDRKAELVAQYTKLYGANAEDYMPNVLKTAVNTEDNSTTEADSLIADYTGLNQEEKTDEKFQEYARDLYELYQTNGKMDEFYNGLVSMANNTETNDETTWASAVNTIVDLTGDDVELRNECLASLVGEGGSGLEKPVSEQTLQEVIKAHNLEETTPEEESTPEVETTPEVESTPEETTIDPRYRTHEEQQHSNEITETPEVPTQEKILADLGVLPIDVFLTTHGETLRNNEELREEVIEDVQEYLAQYVEVSWDNADDENFPYKELGSIPYYIEDLNSQYDDLAEAKGKSDWSALGVDNPSFKELMEIYQNAVSFNNSYNEVLSATGMDGSQEVPQIITDWSYTLLSKFAEDYSFHGKDHAESYFEARLEECKNYGKALEAYEKLENLTPTQQLLYPEYYNTESMWMPSINNFNLDMVTPGGGSSFQWILEEAENMYERIDIDARMGEFAQNDWAKRNGFTKEMLSQIFKLYDEVKNLKDDNAFLWIDDSDTTAKKERMKQVELMFEALANGGTPAFTGAGNWEDPQNIIDWLEESKTALSD